MRILKCLLQYRKWLLLAVALAIVPGVFRGDNDNSAGMPPFDFTNTFYLVNGINPANILSRVNGTCGNLNDTPSCSVVDTTTPHDADRSDIRVLSTTGGFDHQGNPLYYNIFGMANVVPTNTFTTDPAVFPPDQVAAGNKALQIAEFFSAYIFPKASGDPLSPALSNRRQDNVFDTRNGYFVANPLGLWTAVFVSYTPAAVGSKPTAVCKSALSDLAMKNGTDLDGTPQIHKAIEVDDLTKKGCAVQRHRDFNGSQGFPWII